MSESYPHRRARGNAPSAGVGASVEAVDGRAAGRTPEFSLSGAESTVDAVPHAAYSI